MINTQMLENSHHNPFVIVLMGWKKFNGILMPNLSEPLLTRVTYGLKMVHSIIHIPYVNVCPEKKYAYHYTWFTNSKCRVHCTVYGCNS